MFFTNYGKIMIASTLALWRCRVVFVGSTNIMIDLYLGTVCHHHGLSEHSKLKT
jgi:hypothetical protein